MEKGTELDMGEQGGREGKFDWVGNIIVQSSI